MPEEQQLSIVEIKPKQERKGIVKTAVIAGVALLAVLALFFFGTSNQGFFALNQAQSNTTASGQAVQVTSNTNPIKTPDNFESDVLNPADFPVREEFFREVYRPRRETYKLFERAAAFLGKDIDGVKKYFGLNSEEEIFSDLPKPAEDFSEIAYLFAVGKFFSIGLLGPEYYKQPELYPNFKNNGLNYWTRPDPRYWVPHGYGSYPSEQWDTLSLSGRQEFTGVVFVNTGWGVQSYQGFTLLPDTEFVKYFDVEISPQNFLLEPTWPKFHENWAQRVVITGKAKPGTPPGTYKLAVNVFPVPKEFRAKWEQQYKNIYFDAAVSPVKPAGDFIDFYITVTQ